MTVIVERRDEGWVASHNGAATGPFVARSDAVDAGEALAKKFSSELRVQTEEGDLAYRTGKFTTFGGDSE